MLRSFDFIFKISKLPKILVLGLIAVYQKTISPDHGILSLFLPRVCRFEPTCSSYCYQAIKKYGLVRGVFLGSWRVLRCNPLSRGGNDPLK